MGTASSERRKRPFAGGNGPIAAPFHIPRSRAWIILIASVLLIALFDRLAVRNTWFGPAYLMLIGFAAWALGWRTAIAVTLACTGASILANDWQFYPAGEDAPVAGIAMRILAVGMIIALLDNARQSYAREWRLARTDPLTGALNRQAFFELAGTETHSRRWNILAYADLDGLKQLNDVQGHAKGDQGLVAFADHARAIIRKDDVLARIGGDEFLIYMTVEDESAGGVVAERLHETMNRATSATSSQLRCSIGVVIIPPGTRSLEQEMKLADELMYEAKDSGSALAIATLYRDGELLGVHRERLLPGPLPTIEAIDAIHPLPRRKRAEGKRARSEARIAVPGK